MIGRSYFYELLSGYHDYIASAAILRLLMTLKSTSITSLIDTSHNVKKKKIKNKNHIWFLKPTISSKIPVTCIVESKHHL